ncbi:hypothetical protein [Jannaschia sp. 2305UL9-9]|uniref:hypothetical protein n=1 Tax=Jannaschia sp. 2305UL9-9 TaxID=3121638 RepID=UPI00352874C8
MTGSEMSDSARESFLESVQMGIAIAEKALNLFERYTDLPAENDGADDLLHEAHLHRDYFESLQQHLKFGLPMPEASA